MKLRYYQTEAIDKTMDMLKKLTSVLLVMATGTGKTVVFAHLIGALKGKRVMVIAERRKIIMQAQAQVGHITGLNVQMEMGEYSIDMSGFFGLPDVVVSTVQTLTAGADGGGRLGKFAPSAFDYLIIDEAHHAVSPSYRRIVDHFRRNPALKVIGVTATPDRADEEALGQVFEDVAYEYEILDAIEDGFLVPIKQHIVYVETLDLSIVHTQAGDFNPRELAKVLETEKTLFGMAANIFEICGTRSTLVFCATVAQAEKISAIFNGLEPGCAAWVCAKTPEDERAEVLRQVRSGAIRYLCNVGIYTEGFDEPRLEVVAMCSPTKSRTLYTQKAGRGLRPAESIAHDLNDLDAPLDRKRCIAMSVKPYCTILDFCGNAGRHKLITTADILGGKISEQVSKIARLMAEKSGKPEDALELIEKAKAMAERKRKAEIAKRAAIKTESTYKLVDVDPFDVYDIVPACERGWDRSKQLTAGQRSILMRNRIDPDKMSYTQGRQLLGEIFRRSKAGLASFGQQRVLARYGYTGPVTRADAKAILDGIAKKEGWKR